MKVRQDVALLGNDLAPTSWAIANSLYVYPLGAIVQRDAGVVTGNTIPVHTGHTFADLDKVYLYRQGQEGRIIATCTGAQLNRELTLDAVVQVLGGDILVNLGQDTTPDPALPAFNGSRAPTARFRTATRASRPARSASSSTTTNRTAGGSCCSTPRARSSTSSRTVRLSSRETRRREVRPWSQQLKKAHGPRLPICRVVASQPAGGEFPVFGVHIGTFDQSSKDVIFSLINNSLWATSIQSGSNTELASDLSNVRARRNLSAAHMNDRWFLTSGLNRNSVVDQDLNHREMGMLTPEGSLDVAAVGQVGSNVLADITEAGNEFIDPGKAYDLPVDSGTFAYATLDGVPDTPGESVTTRNGEWGWTSSESELPRVLRAYVWLRPYNIPGGNDTDQPDYDAAFEAYALFQYSEDGGSTWNSILSTRVTNSPINVIQPISVDANLVKFRATLYYPHDKPSDGDEGADTGGIPVTLRIYNLMQVVGASAQNYTHPDDKKTVVAYTEWDDVNQIESGISPERDVIFDDQVSYTLSNFKIRNPNTTHFKIYRTPLVDRFVGTGREIASGFRNLLGLVDIVPASEALVWTDRIELPLDIQPPNLLEQVIIIGGTASGTLAYDMNTPPPRFQHISVFKGQLVGVYGRTLRASMPGRPESWPIPYIINSFPLAENDNLVATFPVGEELCIGARSVMMAVDRLPSVDRNGQFISGRVRVVADFGLVSPKAITGVSMGKDEEDLCAWVSESGIHLTNGYTARRITNDIDWDELKKNADLADSSLMFNPETMQLRFSYGNRFMLLHMDPSHVKENGQPKITYGHYGKLLDQHYANRRGGGIVVSGHASDGRIYYEEVGSIDESNTYDAQGNIPFRLGRHYELDGYKTKITYGQLIYRIEFAFRQTHIAATVRANMGTAYNEFRSVARSVEMTPDGSAWFLLDRSADDFELVIETDDRSEFSISHNRLDVEPMGRALEQIG